MSEPAPSAVMFLVLRKRWEKREDERRGELRGALRIYEAMQLTSYVPVAERDLARHEEELRFQGREHMDEHLDPVGVFIDPGDAARWMEANTTSTMTQFVMMPIHLDPPMVPQ